MIYLWTTHILLLIVTISHITLALDWHENVVILFANVTISYIEEWHFICHSDCVGATERESSKLSTWLERRPVFASPVLVDRRYVLRRPSDSHTHSVSFEFSPRLSIPQLVLYLRAKCFSFFPSSETSQAWAFLVHYHLALPKWLHLQPCKSSTT